MKSPGHPQPFLEISELTHEWSSLKVILPPSRTYQGHNRSFTRLLEIMATEDQSKLATQITTTINLVSPFRPSFSWISSGLMGNEDNFLDGIRELGIPINEDPNSGNATGASIVPSSMSGKNQSRADARTAYLDPALERPNLHLITGYSVTRVLHGNGGATSSNSTHDPRDSGLRVTGVEVSVNVCFRYQPPPVC